ncbi:MAG: redoxin domain-containing protein, partial [Candidatus Thiodiazotropha sp.]
MPNRSLLFPLVSGLFSFTREATQLDVGIPAPAFRLPDQRGKIHDLGAYRGRWLVLYFYPKDDTPGCRVE